MNTEPMPILPSGLQEQMVAAAVQLLAIWLAKLSGGTALVACTVPGVQAEAGKLPCIVYWHGGVDEGEALVQTAAGLIAKVRKDGTAAATANTN